MAFADNVQDSVPDTDPLTGAPIITTITRELPESFTTRYYITPSSNTGELDPPNCNIPFPTGGQDYVEIFILVGDDPLDPVIVEPNPVRIYQCQNELGGVDVTFSSTEGGVHPISATISDPDVDSSAYKMHTDFILEFLDPDPVWENVSFSPTDNPVWGTEVVISGNILNSKLGQFVRVESGSGLEDWIAPGAGGYFEWKFDYVQPTTDPLTYINYDDINNGYPFTPKVSLVVGDGGTTPVINSLGQNVELSLPQIYVAKATTNLTLQPPTDIVETKQWDLPGTLMDESHNMGLSGYDVSLVLTGSTPTSGTVKTNGVGIVGTQVEVTECLGGCADVDYIARLPAGSKINLPSNPPIALVTLRDQGTATTDFKVFVDADNDPLTDCAEVLKSATGDGVNKITVPFTNEFGICSIEIVNVTGGGDAGITRILTHGPQLGTWHDVEFTSAVDPFDSKTFADGRFLLKSELAGVREAYEIEGNFAFDADYLDATKVQGYDIGSKIDGTLSGKGTFVTIPDDDSTIRVFTSCNADADKDGVCDDWETAGGIPFTANAVNYVYPLALTNIDRPQIYVEHDAFVNHAPSAIGSTSVLGRASTVFSNMNIDLVNNLCDTNLTDVAVISVWQNADSIDNNDYNSIAWDNFGCGGEHLIMSAQSAQAHSYSTTTKKITLSGIKITVPTNSITSGRTEGIIYAKFIVQTGTTGTTISLGAPNTLAATGGITFGAITTEIKPQALPYKHLVIVKIPFTTTTSTAQVTVPSVLLPLTMTNKATNLAYTTAPTFIKVSGSPFADDTLLQAKAKVYRYTLWGHSSGLGTTGLTACTSNCSSGQSEPNGNNIFISLGVGFGTVSNHSVGTDDEKLGTFLHELGHTLDLNHGGTLHLPDDLTTPSIDESLVNDTQENCKPNYPSVMSYSRQFSTQLNSGGSNDWVPTYSPGLLGTINETNLSEGPIAGPSTKIIYGHGTLTGVADIWHKVNSNDSNIDWNHNGVADSGYPQKVGNLGFLGCDGSTSKKVLKDYDDKSFFRYTFSNAAGILDGASHFSHTTGGTRQYELLTSNSLNMDLISPVTTKTTASPNTEMKYRIQFGDQSGNLVSMPLATGKILYSRDGGVSYQEVGTMASEPNGNTLSGSVKFTTQLDRKGDIRYVILLINVDSANTLLVRDYNQPAVTDPQNDPISVIVTIK